MPWQRVPNETFRGLTDANFTDHFPGGAGNPRFFMSGDGHRTPPFEWTMSCIRVREHFQALVRNNQLCAHVEEQPDQVGPDSVPPQLSALLAQGRVFGWELEIYKALRPIMEESQRVGAALMTGGRAAAAIERDAHSLVNEITRVDGLLWKIGNPQRLRDRARQIQNDRVINPSGQLTVNRQGPPMVDPATCRRTGEQLVGYANDCMTLRSVVNDKIGENIVRVIGRHPNATHIISCGFAHIMDNDLSQYVNIGAAHGLVDASPNR